MKAQASLKKRLKGLRYVARNLLLQYRCRHIISSLQDILKQHTEAIPVFIVSYNNGIYVENTTKQLNNLNIKPIIFDNKSTQDGSLTILKSLDSESKAHIIYSSYNFGHMIGFIHPIYKVLPEVFAYTDPDLQFNTNLPNNFLDVLATLTEEYNTYKAGFALSLHNSGELKDIKLHCLHTHPIIYDKFQSIEEFESKHWLYRLQHDSLELYASPIDTTFAVYRKSAYIGDFHRAVRVAGNFSATHLPWFKELDMLSKDDTKAYLDNNTSSNWVQKK